MIKEIINKKQIADLLPHREPMLLIDELHDIEKLVFCELGNIWERLVAIFIEAA